MCEYLRIGITTKNESMETRKNYATRIQTAS